MPRCHLWQKIVGMVTEPQKIDAKKLKKPFEIRKAFFAKSLRLYNLN